MQEHDGTIGLPHALLLTCSGAVDAGMLLCLWMQLPVLLSQLGRAAKTLLGAGSHWPLARLPAPNSPVPLPWVPATAPGNCQQVLNEAGGSGHPLKGSL